MILHKNISKIGIGTYKMTNNIINHKEAIEYALEKGINLIDTASNYQNGNPILLRFLLESWTTQNIIFLIKILSSL